MPQIHESFPEGSVGKILPNYDVVFATSDGSTSAPNQEGEILVKGPYIFDGYYEEPRDTNDYFATGDIGYIDESGSLFITGRKKDIIIRSGFNISPKEIEDVILSIANIEDVAVVGIDHPLYGEEIVAAIKSSENMLNSNEIRQICNEYLAKHKVPSKFILLENFPYNASGKPDKLHIKQIIKANVQPSQQ